MQLARVQLYLASILGRRNIDTALWNIPRPVPRRPASGVVFLPAVERELDKGKHGQ